MTGERVKRKLSAILSADAVDYSRLMGDDEVSTVKTLEAYREVMSDLIAQFRGRVVDSPGDNLLAEFSSVVDAVQCAVEIHEIIKAKNEELPEDRRMLFRIGVNLGDVIQEGERIYGDGVNIAARLEGLAEPGGVCISGSAYEQIKNKLALGYVYIGEHSVKNIAEPLKVYKVPMGVEAVVSEEKKEKKPKLKKQPGAPGTNEASGRSLLRHAISWIAVIILVTIIGGLIVGGIMLWVSKPEETRKVIRFSHELSTGQEFAFLTIRQFDISPDGEQLVYATREGLFLRSLTELNARLITGTEGQAEQPFFSSDGEWIGYFSPDEHQMKKISVNGGASVTLAKINGFIGANWDENDTILFGTDAGGIMKVSAQGGTPEKLVELVSGMSYGLPQILPGGRALLFTAYGNPNNIMVKSMETGELKELFPGDGARYLPGGHLVYAVGNDLFAVPFDLEKLEVTGSHIPLFGGVFRRFMSQFAVSDSGTLAFIPGLSPTAGVRKLVWVDREGREEPIAAEPRIYRHPKISPDGKKLALSVLVNNNQDIWIWDTQRENQTRLTFHENSDFHSIWTLDGKRIVFFSARDENGIYWKSADGIGKAELLFSSTNTMLLPHSWSKEQDKLVLGIRSAKNVWYIGMLPMEGDRELETLLNEGHSEIQPQISPDGRWIAYTSNESGKNDIYVRPFPDVETGKWQVSTNGGDSPLWSPNSKELFYLVDDNYMVVSFVTEPAFKSGKPEVLFSGPYISGMGEGTPWDIHPDGDRFLMMKIADSDAPGGNPRRINVFLNWDEELKKRVPVD